MRYWAAGLAGVCASCRSKNGCAMPVVAWRFRESEAGIYRWAAEVDWVVWLAEEMIFNADDVLKGRVNLEAVTARYVVVYSIGLIGPATGIAKKLILAVNYMAKLGWRVAGYSANGCIMEKPEHA